MRWFSAKLRLTSTLSSCFLSRAMSVRLASALAIAPSTSMAIGVSDGASVGSIRVVQKSGWVGFRIRERSRSSTVLIRASALITASSLLATSASASMMSIGASVPTSTLVWLFLSDSCASRSDSSETL